MRKLKLFSLLCLLLIGVGQMWAADPAYVELCTSWSSTMAYATAYTHDYTIDDLNGGTITMTLGVQGVYRQANANTYFQMNKKTGYFKNTTKLPGKITKIETTWSAAKGATKCYFANNAQATSSDATVTVSAATSVTYTPDNNADYYFFNIDVSTGSGSAQMTSCKVYYTTASGGGDTPEEPTACADPEFSPEGGAYEGSQNVEITCSTEDATIYYTTDGSTPTTSSSVYSTAIPVTASTTIKAYAVKTGLDDSGVAEAAYVITAGPDVTLDFTNNTGWSFPTSKTVTEGSYTKGDYTVKVAGSTSNGFYFDATNSNLLVGKSGAYLILPTFDRPITKVVTTAVSGGSGTVTFNLFQGETAVSTQVTGCTSAQTFEIAEANQKADVAHKIKVTSAANVRFAQIKIYLGAEPEKYAVTLAATGGTLTATKGGAAFASGTAAIEGAQLELTATPDETHTTPAAITVAKTVGGDDVTTSVLSGTTLTVPAYAITVSASFTPTYAIEAATVTGGSFSWTDEDDNVAPARATAGTLIQASNSPADTHNFTSYNIYKKGDTETTVDHTDGLFEMPAYDVVISGTFTQKPCTQLGTPANVVVGGTSYPCNAVTLNWDDVNDADNYEVVIKKAGVQVESDIVDASEYACSTTLLANTTYTYEIKATAEDDATWCASEIKSGEFATSDYPAATLTLSEVGAENDYTWGSGLKLNSEIALPSSLQHSEGCSDKVLVGWSSVAIAEPGDEPTANYWEAGADYTMLSTAEKLYAVYAAGSAAGDVEKLNEDFSGITSGNSTSTSGSSSAWTPNSNFSSTKSAVYQAGGAIRLGKSGSLITKALDLSSGAVTVSFKLKGWASGEKTITVQVDDQTAQSTTCTGYIGSGDFESKSLTFAAGTSSSVVKFTTSSSVRVFVDDIVVSVAAEASYSDYTTACEAALPVLAAPTFSVDEGTYYAGQSVELVCTTEGATIYYTIDGSAPSTSSTKYTAAISLSERAITTIKAIAVAYGYENSEVAEATYNINLPYDFADFAALEKVNNKEYAVRGIISQIDELYNNSKLIYHISGNGSTEGQIKCFRGLGLNKATFSAVTDVNKGDNVTVVGTWSTQYSNLNQDNWMLEYTARVHGSYEIVGGLTSTTFQVGEAFDNAILGNLSVKEVFTNGYEETVAGATFNCGDKTEWLENETSLTVYAKLGDDDLTSKNFGVTVSSATLVSFVLKEGYKTEYYVGDEFVKPTVIATLTDNTHPEAEATACTGYNMSAAGNYTVNVAFTYGDITIDEGVTYQITVKAVFDNEDAPHTVAKAIELIEASAYQAKQSSTDYMWVSGKVSGFNGTSNKNYYISDDGTATGQLYVYSGSYFGGVAFTDANKLHVGDEVILKATILNYNGSTAELTNSQVVSQFRAPEFAFADIVAGDEFEANVSEDMAVVPTSNEGNAEFTLSSNNEEAVTIVEGKLHAVAEGDAVITASRAATANENALNYKAKEITFNVHVIAERTRYTVTFDANGGEGTDPEAIDPQLAGATVDMPAACLYNKEGHAFTGWKVINLSTEAEIEVENDQFEMPAANVKIQAQWAVVATCAISFQIGGHEVATANAPQEADYNISQVGAAVSGFTFLGWSETEYADEVETAPTLINVYHAQAGEESKVLYGIYKRVEGAGESNHYILDYATEGLADNTNWGAYATAYDYTAADDGEWTIKAYKQSGMQINTGKSAYIKVPVCPANIEQIVLTCNSGAKNAVKFCATASDGAAALANGTAETTQTLDLSSASVTTGYIIPTGNCQITHIDVAYSAEKTYYTSSPVEKVTVTFALDGGQGGCQTTKINKGSEFTICAEVPTKSHSEFAGWKNGDDEYVAGTAYTFNANITLTAQWNDAQTYTVTFDKNEGTGTAENLENQYAGDPITLPAALTKSGFTFQGWKYNDKLYKAGASFTMVAANIEFVAQYRKASIPVDKMSMVTSASALANGMQIALGCSYGESNFAMAGDITGNNKYMSSATENVSLIDGVATYTEDVVIMTLEQVENGWKITKDGTNYLTSSGQDIVWATSDVTVWTISFNGNNVVIANGNNKMQYNKQNPRFKTYSTNQTAIQLFGKAVVVSEDASISDLGYTEGEDIIASGDMTLTIDEETNAKSITAQNGATVVVEETTTATSIKVDDKSKINITAQTTVNEVFSVAATMGGGKSGQVSGVDKVALAQSVEAYFDITLGANGTSAQWHAIAVPFPVDAINGIYDAATGEKLTNEVNYAIMAYDGAIRATGAYGWKKYRQILQPGVFYLMTVDGDTKTFRFKMSGITLPTATSLALSLYAASGDGQGTDAGWNGVANPTLKHGTVNQTVTVLNPETYTYEDHDAGSYNFVVGTPFFIQADATIVAEGMEMGAVDGEKPYYAPRRASNNIVENIKVFFGNEEYKDKLTISANEEALNEYQIGKDLVKMTMTNTPKVAQIFGNAYNAKLCRVYAPMSNDKAEYSLTLYAPEAGEYTISVPEMENAEIYLTKDGAIIWNLTMSEYTNDFAKGNNEGYGLLLIKKITGISTGVENIEAAEAGVQKVVIDDKVFILRGEKMYDVTGKMVK